MKEDVIVSARKARSVWMSVSRLLRLINAINEYTGKVVSLLVWVGAILLTWEVVSRYFFNAPTVWAHGYSQRIFGAYFIMIGAFTLLKGGHVRIDLITSCFSYRLGKGFDLLNYAFLIFWGGFIIKEGWTLFLCSWRVKEVDEMALAHPVYPFKFILVVGAVLITLQAVAFFAISAIAFIKGEDYEP